MVLYGGAWGRKGVDEATLSRNNRLKRPQCLVYTGYTASFNVCHLILSLEGVQCHTRKQGGAVQVRILQILQNCCCTRIYHSGCYMGCEDQFSEPPCLGLYIRYHPFQLSKMRRNTQSTWQAFCFCVSNTTENLVLTLFWWWQKHNIPETIYIINLVIFSSKKLAIDSFSSRNMQLWGETDTNPFVLWCISGAVTSCYNLENILKLYLLENQECWFFFLNPCCSQLKITAVRMNFYGDFKNSLSRKNSHKSPSNHSE